MKSRRMKALAAFGVVGVVGGGAIGMTSASAVQGSMAGIAAVADAAAATRPAAATAPAQALGSLPDMVQAVGPAVVQIQAEPAVAEFGRGGSPFGGVPGLFGQSVPQPNGSGPATLGSGFVIDPSGIVVTNNHVVAGADRVKVTFSDGRVLAGRVLGRDPKTDLAVVKIDGDGRFQAIPWGDSDGVRVGESVFAVGSPFGLGNSVTSGILSARGREIGAGPYDDFLQVDAPINSGNSGGPLFNAAGQVIGVNTAIFSPSGGNVGIGFAIPSRMAQSVVRQIVDDGEVERGRIGVLLQELTPDVAEALRLRDAKGALIADVEPGGPAASAGIQRGDVVTAFAGRPIADSRALSRAVADAKPGSRVAATVRRDGREGRVKIAIDASREG